MSQAGGYYKSFCAEIDALSRRYDALRVFDDFLTMAVCSFHQINITSRLQQSDPENETCYLETIRRYERNELDHFARLLAIVKLHIYDNPYSDLLGEYFTLNITNGRNGQYFTPEPICALMASLHGTDEQPTGKCVYDPACGSGRLLLQFAKTSPDNYFFANDLSMTCAKMTAINFMLNGLRGEVACLNALSWEWFSGWKINQPVLGILPLEKENSSLWNSLSLAAEIPTECQLTLF